MAAAPGDTAGPPAWAVRSCGAPWVYRAPGWPLIPLALVGGLLAIGLIGWALRAPGWSIGPGPFFWPFVPVGVILAIVLGMVLLRRTFWGYGWHGRWVGAGDVTAEEILRGRFARGEITRDQYYDMRKVLEGTEPNRGRPLDR